MLFSDDEYIYLTMNAPTVIRRPLLSSAASVRIDGIPTLSFRAARAGAMAFTRSLGSFTQEFSAAVNRTADLNVQPNQPRDYNKDKRIIENAISQASKDTGGDEYLYPLLVKISIFVSVAERLAKVWRAFLTTHPEEIT